MLRVTDDGQRLTLDLHGLHVGEAEAVIQRAARLAAERGRATLVVVHGASTSSRLYRNRTIKHALADLLDRGALRPDVTDSFSNDGSTLLNLAAGRTADSRPITASDLWS